MKNNKKKGFTLVELLVVIAILAILATVSILGYTSFTAKAKASVAEQELTQIKTILLADWLDGFIGEATEKNPITKDTDNYTVGKTVTVADLKAVFGEEDDENYDYAEKVSFYGVTPKADSSATANDGNEGEIKFVVYEQGNGYFAVWKIADDKISTYTTLPSEVTGTNNANLFPEVTE